MTNKPAWERTLDKFEKEFEKETRRPVVGLNEWLSILTRLGYDPDGCSCHTARGDWNANHPINTLTLCFRREKSPDIILSSYSLHGAIARREYARVCWPTKSKTTHMAFGFIVAGQDKNERSTSDPELVKKWVDMKTLPKQPDE